jgi:hypothetical protein
MGFKCDRRRSGRSRPQPAGQCRRPNCPEPVIHLVLLPWAAWSKEVWIHLCAITTGSTDVLIGNASGTRTAIGVGHRDSDARYGPLVLIVAERKWLPCLNHSQRHALSTYARQFPASIHSRLNEKSHREDCLSKVPVVTLAFWEACRPFARGTGYGCGR